MKIKDKAVKKTEIVIRVMEYAQKHHLDIKDRNHVRKILEYFDPKHVSQEEVNEFMTLLENADTFMEMTSIKKSKDETKLPN